MIQLNVTPNNQLTLHSLLSKQQITLPHSCNGKGTCGKCKVRILSGTLSPSQEDILYFTQRQLMDGYRLSCCSIPKEDLTISLEQPTLMPIASTTDFNSSTTMPLENTHTVIMLIDLGTTTVGISLHSSSGQQIDALLFTNPQIPWGADVMARIKEATIQDNYPLGNAIRQALTEHVNRLLTRQHLSISQVSACYLAGNTTMIHLLMDYPCEGLGVFPFTPFKSDFTTTDSFGIQTTIFPSSSAFIGGDIVAGIYAYDFHSRKDTALLIDLGTNGEMALVHNEQIYASSVAAGPAFEGGTLSCGCPSIPGAIHHVTLGTIMPKVSTIHNKLPIGICGTGAISILGELLRLNYINHDGIITDAFPEQGILLGRKREGGELRFTKDDVRQMQLSLAAIRAGIYTLLRHCDLAPTHINAVYLAGGFGTALPAKDAFAIFLFPLEWEDRLQPVGNSCLQGLNKYAQFPNQNEINQLLQQITTLSLAETPYFQKQFIDSMKFAPLEIE